MAKRSTKLMQSKGSKRSHKTKSRLAKKYEMLAARAATKGKKK